MEKKQDGRKNNGGRREGAGRHKGSNKTPISLRIENDLLDAIPKELNRNQFINDSIREKAERERLI